MVQFTLKTLLALPYTISVFGNLTFIFRFLFSPRHLKRLSNRYIFLLSIIHAISGYCSILVFLPSDNEPSKIPEPSHLGESICAGLSAALVLIIIGERYYHNLSLTTPQSSESKLPTFIVKLAFTIYFLLLISFITGEIAFTVFPFEDTESEIRWKPHPDYDDYYILDQDVVYERFNEPLTNKWIDLEIYFEFITGFLLPILPTIYYFYRTKKLLQQREVENRAIRNTEQNDESDRNLPSTQLSMEVTRLALTIVRIHFICWIPFRLVNTSFAYDYYPSEEESKLELVLGRFVYFWKDLQLIINLCYYGKYRNTIFSKSTV